MGVQTTGLSVDQMTNGTPSTKKIVLKAFFKDDKCFISPAKDINGRYVGIQENIPEIKKLEMGYVPTVDSRVKVYDGLEIDLNDDAWAKDWEWMKHCREISDTFKEGQNTPGAYFYVFRPGFESSKKVNAEKELIKLKGYILNDSPNDLYNRVKVLGMDMDGASATDVQEYLLELVETSPEQIKNVYEGRSFALELLYLHAIEKSIIKERGGAFVYGDIFLGVDNKSVISYLGNPRNTVTVATIEAATYGRQQASLADEVVADTELEVDGSTFDDETELAARAEAAVKPKAAVSNADKMAAVRAAKKK